MPTFRSVCRVALAALSVAAFLVPASTAQPFEPTTVELTGTIRDFSATHPDMQYRIGIDGGITESVLGPDDKPVYTTTRPFTRTTNGREFFDQWYRDVPGVNVSAPLTIPLTNSEAAPTVFTFDDPDFFPIDDQLMGNQGLPHNYYFTFELHSRFTYRGGEVFTFRGDDDVFVFINKRRVIDLGGVHGPLTGSVSLDFLASSLGLVVGETYDFDFFFAERYCCGSSFRIQTSITLEQPPPPGGGATLENAGPATSDHHDAVTVAALLLDDALDPPAGIADSIVTFTLGERSCQAPTDDSGLASCVLTPDLAVGDHPLEIAFAGDVGHPAAALTETFTVTAEETLLTLTSAPVQAGPGALVSAVLREDGALDLAGRTVTFAAGGETADAVTGPDGVASAALDLPPGTTAVEATFAGDDVYEAATASGSVEVVAPQLSLTPEAQVVSAGTQAQVAAQVPDLGAPRGGLPVVFTVVSGPNLGVVGSCQPADCTTDGSGTVTFSYTGGLTDGEDLVTAFLDLDGDGLPGLNEASDSARVLQQALAATALTYVGATAGDFHDPTELAAVLADSTGTPVAGARLAFTLAGESCEASTGADGRAACFVTPAVAAGLQAVAVAFTGTPTLLPSATTADFSVALEQTTLTLALVEAQVAGEVTASATLLEDGAVALGGRTVTFTAGTTVATATTEADGTATVDLALDLGVFSVEASYAGDGFYQPADAEAGSTVVYEPGQFVIWGGNAPTVAEALTLGETYNFWGAQWVAQVESGDYQANASFKGYAATVFPETFTWETRPGNSSDPPPTVPGYMSVIVATSIEKQGSTIRGNIAAIGVVRVLDPAGYQPNPGHAASGELVALLPANGIPEVPGTSPGAPMGVQAVAGAGSATVSWQPPSDLGDPPLSGSVVIVDPGGAQLAVPAGETSRVVTGLEAGVAYTFTVEAVNAAGAGPASAPSDAVTLVGVPGPATAVAASAGDGTVAATWQPPASDGGSAVTSYVVTAVPGGVTSTVPAGTLAAQLTGLANGVTYSVTVVAVNAAGAGPPSAPPATATPLGLPGSPTILGASPGDGQVTVYLAGPASAGGAEVTSYVVTASPSGASATVPGSQGFAVVSSLDNGVSTTFTAAAVTAAGTGPTSAPSASIVPFGVPAAPVAPTAEAGNASARVLWGVPAVDGGRPVTGYLVTPSPGAASFAVPAAELERLVTELANGTALTLSVAAVNAAGAGAAATTASVIPATVPDGPVDVAAVAEPDGSLSVTWQPPSTDGGSAVTSYLVEAHVVDGAAVVVASTEVAAPAAAATLTGLDLGVEVVVTVRALNALGTGPQGVPAPPVTPAVPPDPPTDVLAVASAPASATVSWLAPDDDGGSPVTSYTVTSSSGGLTATVAGETTSAVIPGLTLGTSYTFTVVATNSAGDSLASAPSNALVAATVPDPPTAVTAVAGNAQATVSWQAPFDGFSPLSLYTVTASPGGATATVDGATTTAIVGGLTNGTSYTFTVTATNGVGTSAPSAPTNAVTPATVPGAPTATTVALAGDRAVDVSWAPPASDGGSAITSYTVTSNPGGVTATVAAPATTATVSGLLAGTTYTFTVRAANDRGEGPPSAPSNPVTAASGPGAPTAVAATAGDGEATVSWAPPASDGGSVIVSYAVVSSPGAVSVTVGGGVTTAVVGGLTNGTTYTFTVTAANVVGAGPPSAPSNAVTPATVPGAPTGATAQVGGDAAALVSWTPPASNGGAPVQSYTVISSPGGLTATALAPATSAVVSGLALGTSYTFTVTATNAAGTGPPSAPSNAVTAVAVPDVPTDVTATAGDGEATVSWTPPADPAGQPVTSYTVTSSPGSISVTIPAPATSATVGGLTNGTTYTFTVTATNAVGDGPPSAPSNAVTPQPGGVVALSSLAVTPGRVESGETATGTVTLTEPSPAGGTVVTLASSGPAATVPATVTVLEGDLTASFTVTTASVAAITEVDLSASLEGTTIIVVFTVDPIPAGTPPTAEITSPADDATVSAPEDILGTATGAGFQSYTLEIGLAGDGTFTEIVTSTTPVSGGVLGDLDPTLLLNDLYTLRLTVVGQGGATAVSEVVVQVAGDLKVGNFSLTFEDLNVPLSGIPITIVRSYDSRDKGKGDFGVGWRLGIQTFRIRANRVQGDGWRVDRMGTLIPTYTLVPEVAHKVSLTLPSGRVEEFDFAPTPSSQALSPIRFLTAAYTPRPGTRGTLQPLGNDTLVIEDAQPGPVTLLDDSTFDSYDPQLFAYTGPDGSVLEIHRQDGVRSFTDRNGNSLTIGPGGIVHSTGRSVTFSRDAQDRITSITDPEGGILSYAYDAAGDLTSFTDQEGSTTRFTYDGRHGLLELEDPRGITPVRYDYDATGRIIRQTDAFGRVTEIDHDMGADRQVVTNRLGDSRIIEYDSAGNVVREVDEAGEETARSYDSAGNVLTETDAEGNVRTFTYDADGNVTSVADATGGTVVNTFNSFGQVLTSTDALGGVTTFTYDALGNVLTRTDPAGAVTTLTYDANGDLLTLTDPEGGVLTYEYDAFGNRTREIDPLGNDTVFTYDSLGNVLTQTETRTTASGPEVLETRFVYDGKGRVVQVIEADGGTTTTTYDLGGQIASVVDELGETTSFTYDSMGRATSITYPDGTSEARTYDAEGRMLTETDRAGRVTTFTYDAAGNQLTKTYPDGSVVSHAYDGNGRRLSTTDELGNVTTFEYDGLGRTRKVTDALGGESVFGYDANGNRISMEDPRGNVTTYRYDAADRMTAIVYPDGTERTIAYDGAGRRTAETDQGGNTTQYGYDAAGQLVSVTDPLGSTTTYAYDEVGNRISETDASGRVTTFEYDRGSRLLRRELPDGSAETFTYDAAGRQISRTDFAGATTTFTYDSNDRVRERTYADSSQVTFTYTPTGERATVVDDSGTTTYGYDARDRLTSLTYPDGRALQYGRDAAGNRTELTAVLDSVTLTTAYAYDALHRLTTVTDPNGSVYTQSHDANGNRLSLTHPNGVTTTAAYDGTDRLAQLTSISPSAGTIQSYTYTRGPTGATTAVTEGGGVVRVYTYDALFQLTGETLTSPAGTTSEVFTYDPVGNRLSRVQTALGGTVTSTTSTYDSRDRLISDGSTTLTWNVNGELEQTTGPDAALYGWNLDGRLTSYQPAAGSPVTYTYDADGNRLQVTNASPASTTNLLVDPAASHAQVVAETDAAGNLVAYYVRGDDLLAVLRPGESRYYHADALGSVRRLTDETGTVTDTYTYSAFGELTEHVGSDPNPFLFTGEARDAGSGLSYLRERWMDPATGRFLSQDPFTGRIEEPFTLHRYLYAANNPVNRIDPSGLDSFEPSDPLLGTAVHSLIFADYGCMTGRAGRLLNRVCDRQISTILRRFGIQSNSRLKPDLVEISSMTVYEVKPVLSALAGYGQLATYIAELSAAGVWLPGTTYTPPPRLVVGGKIIEVDPPNGGLIKYRVRSGGHRFPLIVAVPLRLLQTIRSLVLGQVQTLIGIRAAQPVAI